MSRASAMGAGNTHTSFKKLIHTVLRMICQK